jgi:hypothetical protein
MEVIAMEAVEQWVKPGMKVFCPEGKELGTVKAVSADCYHVDVPFAPDYWLRTEDAVLRELEEVVTRFPYEELRDHMCDEPKDGAVAEPAIF